MRANKMAVTQNFSEFYGAWFAIRPANQKLEPFPPQESTTSLAGTEKGGKASRKKVLVPDLFGVITKSHELSELFLGRVLRCDNAYKLLYN